MMPVDAKWAIGKGWTFHVPVRLSLGQVDQAIKKGIAFYTRLYEDLDRAGNEAAKEELALAIQDLKSGKIRQMAHAEPFEVLRS